MEIHQSQPDQLPPPPRIIVIGDVHGDIQAWMRCMYAARLFNENLEWIAQPPNTIVVQLGDQIDSASRGNSSPWESLVDVEMLYLTDRLDDIAKPYGGRVLSLIGNHELMNVLGDFTYVSANSQQKIPLPLRSAMFHPGGTLAQKLAKRNVILQIGSHIFCHGGILPHHLDATPGDQWRIINQMTRRFLLAQPLSPNEQSVLIPTVLSGESILWVRSYMELLSSPVQLQGILQEVLQRMKARYIYIGHNTISHVTRIDPLPLFFLDAAMSRAYPKTPDTPIEFLEILHPDTPQEEFRILHVHAQKMI